MGGVSPCELLNEPARTVPWNAGVEMGRRAGLTGGLGRVSGVPVHHWSRCREGLVVVDNL